MKKIYKTLLLLVLCLRLPFDVYPQEIWETTTSNIPTNGSIYKTDSQGNNYSLQYEFTSIQNGRNPYSGLLKASNNKLYGVTTEGGNSNLGVLYEFDPVTSTYTKKVDFSTLGGGRPSQGLIEASNGKIYGTASQGEIGVLGALFEYDPATNAYNKIFDFPGGSGGAYPGVPMQASNGKLYITAANTSGEGSASMICEYDLVSNSLTKKIDCAGYPWTFTEASNGKLYSLNNISLLEYDIVSNTISNKASIDPMHGENPVGSVMQASNGKLYGVTSGGGANNNGYLFEYDIATGTLAIKYNFPVSSTAPFGSLIEVDAGKLYGVTSRFGGGTAPYNLYQFDFNTNVRVNKQTSNSNRYWLNTPLLYIPGPTSNASNVNFTNAYSTQTQVNFTPGNGAKRMVVIKAGAVVDFIPKEDVTYPMGDIGNGNRLVTDGTGSSVSITGLQPSTQYFVKVFEYNEWGFHKRYRVHDAPQGNKTTLPLPDVSVTTPANNAQNQNVTLTVTSKALTGATTYTLELNDNAQFTGTSIVRSGSRTQSFSGLAYSKQYYTRVKTNLSPDWGLSTTFTTGSPESFSYVTSPANGSSSVISNPTVTANSVIGATTYTIELNTASDFTGTSIVQSGTAAQTFNNLALATTFYTRVKTNLSPNWGQTRSFTTLDALSQSYVITPANNAVDQLWARNITTNTITGASSYTIQLSPVNDFSSGVIQNTGSTPSLAFSGLSYNTLYYSRVSTDLTPGNWGPIRNFTTGNPPNFTFLSIPANGASNINWVTNLTSSLVVSASQYTIEANTASDFTGTSIVHTSSSRVMGFSFAYNQTYYVRIKTDLHADWGPTRSFTTGSPVSYALVTSPANGATGVALTTNVSSNTVTGAASYTIELNTASDFTGTSIVKTSASRTINFSSLSPATTYYNRVTTDLAPGQWGATRSFTSLNPGGRVRGEEEVLDDLSNETVVLEPFEVHIQENPFRETISLLIETPEQQQAQVRLVDLTGKVIHESTEPTNKFIEITPDVSSQVLLLSVHTGRYQAVKRVVKIH